MLMFWKGVPFIFLFLILDLCVTSKGLNFCTSGWLQSPTSYSCIKLYSEKKSWVDARSTCQAVNGDLMINLDDMKQDLIAAQRKRHTDVDFWIGLNDRQNEGHFKWLDGTQMISKTYWAGGQPDDKVGHENCVALLNSKSNIAKWNDLPCSRYRKFFCEVFPDCPGNTFGERCTDICNQTCGGDNNTCKRFDGFCINGCDVGFQGNTCEEPCPIGTFGDKCAKNCNKNCYGSQNICDSITGACSLGCHDGYQGERCETSCEDNTFGADCSENCSKTCAGPNNNCDHVNGSCIFGCDDGYQGERCENFLDSKLDKDFVYSKLAMIASSIFVLVILTCFMICVAIQYSHSDTSSFEREKTTFRSSYTHESSLVFGTARSFSNEEHSNFYARFVSQEKDSNVPARSIVIRNHSDFSTPSRSVEEFYDAETVPVDSYTDISFPVDETLEDFEPVV